MSWMQFIVSCTGYPDHSEHFYIPDADSSVKLWANALNEVMFIADSLFSTSNLITTFFSVTYSYVVTVMLLLLSVFVETDKNSNF